MENATKALLIAGSILIAIILIAMGMRIFNSTTETVDSTQATMNATAITTFNTQFTGFLGTNISGSKVNTLIQKIIASNAVNTNHKVEYTAIDINNAERYNVSVDPTTGYEDGYISFITITEVY